MADPAQTDETPRDGERPDCLARRLAVTKAIVVGRRHPGSLIIGADTVVAEGGQWYGKPKNDQNAREMLRHLSGQRHQVYTGVAVWDPARGWGSTSIAVAHVTFRPLSALEIADYVQSGEPLDKAGAYAIQGRAGQWVVAFEGNLETVIGLPLDVLQKLLSYENSGRRP